MRVCAWAGRGSAWAAPPPASARRLTPRARGAPARRLGARQFFITCAKADFLDGKHVVFGKLIDGLLTLRKIENVATGNNNRPKLPVVITECGEM